MKRKAGLPLGWLLILLYTLIYALPAQASDLSISSAVVNPGGTATLNVVFTLSGVAPASLQWNLNFSPGQLSGISIMPGPAGAAAGKTLYCVSATAAASCILTGLNTNTIGSGVAAYVTATIAPGVNAASIQVSNGLGADSNASSLPLTSSFGGALTAPNLLPFSCTPGGLSQGAASTCTVTLSQLAPTGGSLVRLVSDNALLTVPASVTVAQGAATATFSANASAAIASNQSAKITAGFGRDSQSATINLMAAGVVSGLSCSPTGLYQNATGICTVTLAQPAVAGGALVGLSSNNVLLTVPPFVTVAGGAATATFNVAAGVAIAADQPALLTAASGTSSQTATVNLLRAMAVTGLVCSPATLGQGAVSSCTITLSQHGTKAGTTVTVASDNVALAVPASVDFGWGLYTATFTATAAGAISGNQIANITATFGSTFRTAVVNLVGPAGISGLGCNLASLGQGAVSVCSVTLSQPAPAGGSVVTLTSNNALLGVPASVTVPAGGITASFGATAAASIASSQSATVTASRGGSSQTASISLLAPVLVSGLSCNPGTLGQGAVSGCTVTLSQTAPAGGAMIGLTSNSALLGVPASVTVPAGGITASFSATAAASIASNQSAIVTASVGASAQTASIGLVARVVSGLTCNPASLVQGAIGTCIVTISQPAPATGAVVMLASNNVALSVPASVTISSGAGSASFSATAAASIVSNQGAAVTASLGASTQTAAISLVAPVVSSLSCNPATLVQSAISTCTVTVSQAAPVGGSVLTLASNNALLGVPPSLSLGAGLTTASFSATAATAIVNSQNATVTAGFGGSAQTASINLVAPVIVSGIGCNPASLVQSAVSTCTVTLSQPAPGGGSLVALASNNVLLAVPGSLMVPVGLTTATFSATAAAVISGSQTVMVSASLAGSSQSASIDLVPIVVSSIACNPKGGMSGGTFQCTISLSLPVAADLPVSLSTTSGLLSVPASVTIPNGLATATITATAGVITSDLQVNVNATLRGWTQSTPVSLWSTPVLTAFTCYPATIPSGTAGFCKITMSKAVGDLTIAIGTGNPALQVPASVTVLLGHYVCYVPVIAVAAAGPVTVTASYNGVTLPFLFNVTAGISSPSVRAPGASPPDGAGRSGPAMSSARAGRSEGTASDDQSPGVTSLVCSPRTIGPAGTATCELLVTASAAELPVSLTSDSDQVLVPAMVTTRANQSSLSFLAQNSSVSRQQKVVVTATMGDSTVQDEILVMGSAGPAVRVSARQSARIGAEVLISVAANDTSGLPVQLVATALPLGAMFDAVGGTFAWTPGTSQGGRYRVTFTATNTAGQSSSAAVNLEVGSGAPALDSPASSCSPGAIGTLKGTWLSTSGSPLSDPSGASLVLGGTTVLLDGHTAAVLFSSQDRVDFLCPPTRGANAPLTAVVTTALGSSQPLTIGMEEAVPEILMPYDSASQQGLILFPGSTDLVVQRNFQVAGYPAQPGDRIVILATGLGANPESLSTSMLVKIGDVYAGVESIQAVAGYQGAYAVQVRVPDAMSFGRQPLELQIAMPDGRRLTSNSAMADFEAIRR